jgi:hypothetical protein
MAVTKGITLMRDTKDPREISVIDHAASMDLTRAIRLAMEKKKSGSFVLSAAMAFVAGAYGTGGLIPS